MHLSHRFASASKPAAQKSFDCCLSHFRTSVQPHRPWENSRPSCESSDAKKKNTSHRKQGKNSLWISFALGPFVHKKDNRTPFFGSTLLKLGRRSDYWNQPLNMRMRVSYPDYHETGLCFYLVIHIESLLHLLELFYVLFTDWNKPSPAEGSEIPSWGVPLPSTEKACAVDDGVSGFRVCSLVHTFLA
jgi:hypothetical protein